MYNFKTNFIYVIAFGKIIYKYIYGYENALACYPPYKKKNIICIYIVCGGVAAV